MWSSRACPALAFTKTWRAPQGFERPCALPAVHPACAGQVGEVQAPLGKGNVPVDQDQRVGRKRLGLRDLQDRDRPGGRSAHAPEVRRFRGADLGEGRPGPVEVADRILQRRAAAAAQPPSGRRRPCRARARGAGRYRGAGTETDTARARSSVQSASPWRPVCASRARTRSGPAVAWNAAHDAVGVRRPSCSNAPSGVVRRQMSAATGRESWRVSAGARRHEDEHAAVGGRGDEVVEEDRVLGAGRKATASSAATRSVRMGSVRMCGLFLDPVDLHAPTEACCTDASRRWPLHRRRS